MGQKSNETTTKRKRVKRPVSVRQIAREVGLSHTAVAYALNGQAEEKNIPESTASRIRKVAQKLGWQQNHVMSAMTTGKTRLVGLWQESFGSPYHSWVMNTLEKLLQKDGYAVLASTARVLESDKKYDLHMFNKWSVEGLLCTGSSKWVRAFIDKYPHWRLPMVCLGMDTLTDVPHIDSVYVDVSNAVWECLERWSGEGRKRIAMLSGHDPDVEDYIREKTYRDFMHRRGLEEEMIIFPKGSSQRKSARAALHEYVSEQGCPQAIFCRSDETMIGAHKALCEHGCGIPEDVALLGVDGIEGVYYLNHPVSTVVQPVEEMCRTSWKLLRERLGKPGSPARHRTLEGRLDWQV